MFKAKTKIDINELNSTLEQSETLVKVTILDVNDNYPQFIDSEALVRTIAIDSLTPIGVPLAQFNATDADNGNQGKVSYKIEKNLENLFEIGKNTGELILKESPLANMSNDIYYISIAAFDGGRPALKKIHNVKLKII